MATNVGNARSPVIVPSRAHQASGRPAEHSVPDHPGAATPQHRSPLLPPTHQTRGSDRLLPQSVRTPMDAQSHYGALRAVALTTNACGAPAHQASTRLATQCAALQNVLLGAHREARSPRLPQALGPGRTLLDYAAANGDGRIR